MEGSYYKTVESVREYIELAKDVNGRKLIEKFKSFLRPKAALLELGSGPGTDWEILHESHEVIGSDNSEEFLNHLKSTHPTGEFLFLDAATLNTEISFDGIYSNKVLHHLRKDELHDSIKRQYECLNPNGLVCHSFWRGEGSEIFKGLYVNYHTTKGLKEFFEPYFNILLIEPYAEFEKGDSLLLIGRKKQA